MTLEEHLSYWKRCLEGMPDSLDLSTDRPRSVAQTFRGGIWQFGIGKDVVERLEELGQRNSASLFMVLLAAFKLILVRYTGQEDVAVGTPVAKRSRPETEGVVGLFLNTLVLRTDLSGDPTFVDLLKRVREALLDAYEHQDLPFERLVEVLQPTRDLSRSPLIQVMIDFVPVIQQERGFPKSTGISKCDLTLILSEAPEGVSGRIEYNSDLFDQETIENLSDHFKNILEEITKNSEAPISQIQFLSKEDRHKILVEWNKTEMEFPSVCLHDLFWDTVRRAPAATALIYGDQRISYLDLDKKANQLAHYLKTLGIGPDDIIGLCIERSIEMVIGLLGILKAGAAYLPLDPAYPFERLAFMVEDSGTRIVISTDGKHLPFGPRCQVISLDSDREKIEQQPDSVPQSGVRPHNLAYVIYTSGSTGKPKGVMVQHRAITNYVQAVLISLELNEAKRALLHTSLCFDLALTILYPALIAGAELILAK